MTDKELGKALLTLDTAPKPGDLDPRLLARNIVARDNRRLRWLAGVVIGAWIVATAGIVWLATMYFMMVEPRLQAYANGHAVLQQDWNDWARAGEAAARTLLLCLFALLFAAVSTVVLILLSRRATLRQINAHLAELSQQLRA